MIEMARITSSITSKRETQLKLLVVFKQKIAEDEPKDETKLNSLRYHYPQIAIL